MKRLLSLAALLFAANSFAGYDFSEYFVKNLSTKTIDVDLNFDETVSVPPGQRLSVAKVYRTGGGLGLDWTGAKSVRIHVPGAKKTLTVGALGNGRYSINKAPWQSRSGAWHRQYHSEIIMDTGIYCAVDCYAFSFNWDFEICIFDGAPDNKGDNSNVPVV